MVVRADEVKRVAVIGAGTMGSGIAHVAALAGCHASLWDVSTAATAAAVAAIEANLAKGVARNKVSVADKQAALARLASAATVFEAVQDADVVIEAVVESMDIKRELFASVCAHAPARALLASNTSSLAIADIAAATTCAARVVGMHFFNPVHIMKLVEVIAHDAVDDAALACARGLARRFGKTPIVVKDSPGFASSRLGIALGLEAMRMVQAGVATPADIDTAMTLGYGHPMGPLELTDVVGLDVRLQISDYLVDQLGDRFAAPALLRDMVAQGKLGQKSGEGFYRWKDGKKIIPAT